MNKGVYFRILLHTDRLSNRFSLTHRSAQDTCLDINSVCECVCAYVYVCASL